MNFEKQIEELKNENKILEKRISNLEKIILKLLVEENREMFDLFKKDFGI